MDSRGLLSFALRLLATQGACDLRKPIPANNTQTTAAVISCMDAGPSWAHTLDLAEHDIGRVLMRDLAVAAGSLMVHPNTAQLLRMLLTQTMIQLEEPSEVLADALGSG